MVVFIESYLAFLAFYTFNKQYCQKWSLLEDVRNVFGSNNSESVLEIFIIKHLNTLYFLFIYL